MRFFTNVTLVLVFALGLITTASADATSDARKAIQLAYDREYAAFAKKDAKGVLANMAPDFVNEGPKGEKMTYEQVKQMVPMMLQMMSNIKGSTKITKLTLKGSQAVVNTIEHVDGVISNPQTKRSGKLVIDSKSEDTWVKTAKGWMRKKSKTLSEQQTLDGKPMPGM